MNKRILIFCLFCITQMYSQVSIWSDNQGGWVNDYPTGLHNTSTGLILTKTYNPNSTTLFKYDFYGNLMWEFDAFINHYNYNFLSSTIDENDNIYIILKFGSDLNNSIEIDGVVVQDGISLLKLNPNGELVWSRELDGSTPGAKLFYKNGTIYTMGIFAGMISINNEIQLNSDTIEYDVFATKFDVDGNLIAAQRYGTSCQEYLNDVTIDEDENLYFSTFAGYCSNASTDLIKINSDLEVVWEKNICNEDENNSFLLVTNLYASNNGKVYVWGHNRLEISHPDYTILETPSNCYGGNLLEFSSNDGSFSNLNQLGNCSVNSFLGLGGNGNSQIMERTYMTDFNDDELVVLTSFRNPLTFENGTVVPTSQVLSGYEYINENLLLFTINTNTFEASYISSFHGELLYYANQATDIPGPIVMGEEDTLYMTGAFQENQLHIFQQTVDNNSGNNNTDVFIAKIDIDGILSIDENKDLEEVVLFPNPHTDTFQINSKQPIESFKIYSINGVLIEEYLGASVNQKTIVSNLQQGIYIGKVEFENSTKSIKIIKI